MAAKIEFIGTGDGVCDTGVHFEGIFGDYTLCGLTLDGDPLTSGGYRKTKKRVDCTQCIAIVEFSKTIKKSEYEPN